MPLIERENKKKPQRISVCLSYETFEELSRYCQFIDSSCDHVVSAMIQQITSRDREYQQWKEQPQEAPESGVRVRTDTRGRKKASADRERLSA